MCKDPGTGLYREGIHLASYGCSASIACSGGFGSLKFIAVVDGIPLGHKGTVNIPLRSEQVGLVKR